MAPRARLFWLEVPTATEVLRGRVGASGEPMLRAELLPLAGELSRLV